MRCNEDIYLCRRSLNNSSGIQGSNTLNARYFHFSTKKKTLFDSFINCSAKEWLHFLTNKLISCTYIHTSTYRWCILDYRKGHIATKHNLSGWAELLTKSKSVFAQCAASTIHVFHGMLFLTTDFQCGSSVLFDADMLFFGLSARCRHWGWGHREIG